MNEAIVGQAQAAGSISRALVSARHAAQPLDAFPGELPATLRDAYEVQSQSIAAWPDTVAGWKVGMAPPAFRDAVDELRLAGPIFAKSVRMARPGEVTPMGVFAGGFGAVEAEFLFRLNADAPTTGGPTTREEAEALVAAMHIGVEIASSPMQIINDLGPMSIISDFGNNAGLVVGPEVPGWRDLALEDLRARVHIDDVQVGDATAAAIVDGPIAALQFLIDKCRERGIPLTAGTWISTGAVTGVHQAGPGAQSHVDFGEYGAFDIVLEPIAAQS